MSNCVNTFFRRKCSRLNSWGHIEDKRFFPINSDRNSGGVINNYRKLSYEFLESQVVSKQFHRSLPPWLSLDRRTHSSIGRSDRKQYQSKEDKSLENGNQYFFNSGFYGLPHPSKKEKVFVHKSGTIECGDDVFFLRQSALCMADGVGAWRTIPNGNSKMYSKTLLENILTYINQPAHMNVTGFNEIGIIKTIQMAFDKTINILGSCALCFATLKNNILHIANIGDCGIMVFRDNKIVARSSEQQHSFNTPFQLGAGSLDTPMDAEVMCTRLMEHDTIILASDGLFDNLYDHSLIKIVSKYMKDEKRNPFNLAKKLVEYAVSISGTRNIDTPFSEKAKHRGLTFNGGKRDDISIIVADVVNTE